MENDFEYSSYLDISASHPFANRAAISTNVKPLVCIYTMN